MVGSEVDHKYLGQFAKLTSTLNLNLSNGLYKLLGLSTLLSRKLLRARKQRKLDPTRTTKSLDLYRHIIWMAREGLTILQSEVLPELSNYKPPRYAYLNELQVLALKLNASFLHIFVLFDHTYQTNFMSLVPNFSSKIPGLPNGVAASSVQINGVTIPTTTAGLSAYAYIAPTIEAFNRADAAGNKLLSGSHPLRLSVKLEFSAFTYDCTRDYETSRAIAKRGVDEAFKDMSGMDDETFEDAMELVGTLAIMAKRGLNPSPRPPPPPEPVEGRTPSWDINDDGTRVDAYGMPLGRSRSNGHARSYSQGNGHARSYSGGNEYTTAPAGASGSGYCNANTNSNANAPRTAVSSTGNHANGHARSYSHSNGYVNPNGYADSRHAQGSSQGGSNGKGKARSHVV